MNDIVLKTAVSNNNLEQQLALHLVSNPTTRILCPPPPPPPLSSVLLVTKNPGCNISGTESHIIDPLVSKRPGKKSEIKQKISKQKSKKNQNYNIYCNRVA